MFERFTKTARAVVADAERQAAEAIAGEIRPEHLLLAVLDQPDCLACRVLVGLGAEPEAVRQVLDRQRLRFGDGLDEDDAEALKTIGIDLDEVLRRSERFLGRPSPLRRGRGRARFSRGAKQVLVLALREAVSLGHNYIGTEHLLLGLVRAGDRVLTDTFAEVGVDHQVLRQAVADAVRKAG